MLRTVKYGETSIICTLFTELLGMQSYMVKGVRSARAGSRKANQLFPSSILDMVVHDQPHKNLQIIKEYQPHIIYQSIHEDVVKNGVALFAIEVVTQLLAAHDPQPELFVFLENFLVTLDQSERKDIANFPLYFIIQAGKISGYHISGIHSAATDFVDVHEGHFSKEASHYPPFINGREAALMSELNTAISFEEIKKVAMSGVERKNVLQYFIIFLQLHVPHFRELKTIPILTAILY